MTLKPLIVRYTHALHVATDLTLAAAIVVQPFLAAHVTDFAGLGIPEFWTYKAIAGLLAASALLRKVSAWLTTAEPVVSAAAQ